MVLVGDGEDLLPDVDGGGGAADRDLMKASKALEAASIETSFGAGLGLRKRKGIFSFVYKEHVFTTV